MKKEMKKEESPWTVLAPEEVVSSPKMKRCVMYFYRDDI